MTHAVDTPPASCTTLLGSPTRRRLLALLSGAPGLALEVSDGTHRADPMPRLFAEFRVLVDRHAVALAACDDLEAALLAEVGYPRVRLPRGADGTPRYAADAATIAEAVPPGCGRDRRQRLLRGRQGRWDAAAREAGLTAAQVHEAALDGAVLDASDALLTTPAWTREAVVLKLLVLLATQEPGPFACETTPWRELRLLLTNLDGLLAHERSPAR